MLFGISKKITPRRGAKIDDIIITTGRFGMTGAGLGILLKKNKAQKSFRKVAINSVLLPNPQLRFGILASKYCNSSMDSSDGLSTTLTEMSRSSKKKFIITKIPIADGLEEFARINRKNILDLVFNSGEEYEIVATVSQKNISKIKKIAQTCKVQILEIGYVKNGSGVLLKNDDKNIKIRDMGWKHFRD
jgi:thiamine-monophosphate kinase